MVSNTESTRGRHSVLAGSLVLVLTLGLCIAGAGCGSHSSNAEQPATEPPTTQPPPAEPPPTQPDISVSVSPSTAMVTISQAQQFSASVLNTSNAAVTWTVTGPSGDVGSISDTGLYTAAGRVPSGSVSITATSVADPTKFATASVEVDGYTGMLSYHNDPDITGQNLNETVLNPSNVNATQFGKLFSYALDGQSFTQPLYVSNVPVPSQGKHNLIFAATEHDSVYAFDADSQATLWTVNFTKPAAGVTTVPAGDLGGPPPIQPEIGITGTPVIDGSSGTLFVVAMTKENGAYIHRLHALDITTGKEKFGGPVVIQPSVPGNGGQVVFTSKQQLQRPALLLSGGVVYVCFGSYSDWNPYHGWLVGYDAFTLEQVTAWNATPNGNEGSFWQSGASLAADSAGNIFGIVANGTFDADTGGSDYGESVVKLKPGPLSVTDYFTPFNYNQLNTDDVDFGSAGFTLLPDQPGPFPHLGVSAGKEGKIYLLNRDNLGKFQSGSDSQIVQSIPDAVGASTLHSARNFSTATYWQGNVYFIGTKDVIKQFALTNGLLSTSPIARGTNVYGFPGGNMSISANGSQNGIVWAIEAASVLHAYDATNVARELYNTNQNASRDQFGTAVRFTVPTVMNGKVFVAGKTTLAVFGLF